VGVQKPRLGANELERTVGQLLLAVFSKVLYQPVLSRHHFAEIEMDIPGSNSPNPGMVGEMNHIGGVKQRLGWHAATQDAQPANLFAALDHDDPQAGVRGRPRRGIPGTAAAYHGDIKIKVLARLVHDHRISQAQILFNGQMRAFLKTVWGDLRYWASRSATRWIPSGKSRQE
jgi:hypothetical protein